MRILLIAPTFFGYRDLVKEELAKLGHDVVCVNDRPSESVAFRSLAKMSYTIVDRRISEYAIKLRDFIAGSHFDLVIYMGGMSFCFTRQQFQEIRGASDVRFVAYLWDAFKNCQRFSECLGFFDEVYSFEPVDCEQHDLKFRPLFYSDICRTVAPENKVEHFDYDACFIGSVHQPSKFRSVNAICNQLEAQGYRVFRYFYMPPKSTALQRKIVEPCYRGHSFEFTPLSFEEVVDVYARSRCIIDSPQSGQSGLTMRTLETVGVQRKLITTNADVMHYDFAQMGDVLLYRQGMSISDEFFAHEYHTLPEDMYNSYSLETFTKTLLGEAPTYHGYNANIRKAC